MHRSISPAPVNKGKSAIILVADFFIPENVTADVSNFGAELIPAALIAGSLLAGGIAFANEKGSAPGAMMGGSMMGGDMKGMMNMMSHMKTMDANGDGMLSKEEFVKTHEAMFDSMPKNKDGLVVMKDMSMCPMMAGQKGR